MLTPLQRCKAVFRFLKEQHQQAQRAKEKDQTSLEKTVRVFQEEIQALKIDNEEVIRRSVYPFMENAKRLSLAILLSYLFALLKMHSDEKSTWGSRSSASALCFLITRLYGIASLFFRTVADTAAPLPASAHAPCRPHLRRIVFFTVVFCFGD